MSFQGPDPTIERLMQDPLSQLLMGGGKIPTLLDESGPSVADVMDPELLKAIFGASTPPPDPNEQTRFKILRKVYEERARELELNRKFDAEMMQKHIQADIVQSEKQTKDIQQKVDEALMVLKMPAPTQQNTLSEAETWAGAIGALLAPNNLPGILNSIQQLSGARNDKEFDDKLRQYGLNRETTVMGLKQLLGKLEDEASNVRALRKEKRGVEYGLQGDIAKIESDLDNDLNTLDELELKHGFDLEKQKQELLRKAEEAKAKKAKDEQARKDRLYKEHRDRYQKNLDRKAAKERADAAIKSREKIAGMPARARAGGGSSSGSGGGTPRTSSKVKSIQRRLNEAKISLSLAEREDGLRRASEDRTLIKAPGSKVQLARVRVEDLERQLSESEGAVPVSIFNRDIDVSGGFKSKAASKRPTKVYQGYIYEQQPDGQWKRKGKA